MHKPILFISILLMIAFYFQPSLAQEGVKKMEQTWFANKDCLTLEIKKYESISDHKIIKSVHISELEVINQLIQRIDKLATDGMHMINFGPKAEHIDLVFQCSRGQTQIISIYQTKFKTPSTGFNETNDHESKLYADIHALLFPAP